MFNLPNRGELDPNTEMALENTNARLKQTWLTQHNEDGTHNLSASDIPNLDASKITTGTIPSTRLPADVAYTDVANTFTLDQKITKTRPQMQLLHSGTALSRVASWVANNVYLATNLAFDGTNWVLDDTSSIGISFTLGPSGLALTFASAGSNPRTPVGLFAVDQNGLITTAGQISFPATQNPSSNVNTLDDYEEGTFTPTLGSAGGGTPTYTTQVGRYTKIGKRVYFSLYIVLGSKGTLAAGQVQVNGLPFTVVNGIAPGIAMSNYWIGATTALSMLSGLTAANATNINMYYAAGGGSTSVTPLQVSDIGTNFEFFLSGHYEATA